MRSPVYTLQDAARFLHLTPNQLRYLLVTGIGPPSLRYPHFTTTELSDAEPVFHVADLIKYAATTKQEEGYPAWQARSFDEN